MEAVNALGMKMVMSSLDPLTEAEKQEWLVTFNEMLGGTPLNSFGSIGLFVITVARWTGEFRTLLPHMTVKELAVTMVGPSPAEVKENNKQFVGTSWERK